MFCQVKSLFQGVGFIHFAYFYNIQLLNIPCHVDVLSNIDSGMHSCDQNNLTHFILDVLVMCTVYTSTAAAVCTNQITKDSLSSSIQLILY